MDIILRASLIYFIVFLVFRIAGRRTLSDSTTFDLVLILIISEATTDGLIGEDSSITGAALAIVTLVSWEIILSFFTHRFSFFKRLTAGVPIILVENGKTLDDRIKKSQLNIDDIMEAARLTQGIEHLEEIRYAILENNGEISIIPK